MNDLGLGATRAAQLLFTVGLTLGCGFSSVANAAPSLPLRASAPIRLIEPNIVPQLPPAEQATTLRYPAFGPEVPGVADGISQAGIPASVTLRQAVLIAVASSPVLAAARADVGIAQAQVRLARTGTLPNLAASVNANHSYSGSNFSQNIFSRSNAQNNSASLTLNQLLFDGGKIAAGIRAARYSETAAADTYRRALQTLAFNVATAYYAALNAERATQVNLELVHENTQQEALVVAQVRAGVVARVDQITAEVPVAQAEVAVIQAQGNQISTLATFANVLGLAANIAVQPVDDGPVLPTAKSVFSARQTPTLSYAQAFARAVALRPDLAASQAIVQAAGQNLQQARLGLMPRLAGSYGFGYNSLNVGGGNYTHSDTLGASLAIPLFDQGATAAASAQARANLARAQANEKTLELGISLNVRQSLAQVITARASLGAAAVALQDAIAVLQATQAQYRAGVTTLPQLLNSQVALSQALSSQVSVVYSLRQAQQAFIYALGEDSAQ